MVAGAIPAQGDLDYQGEPPRDVIVNVDLASEDEDGIGESQCVHFGQRDVLEVANAIEAEVAHSAPMKAR